MAQDAFAKVRREIGTSMGITDRFPVTEKLMLKWTCPPSRAVPFMIQIWKITNSGYDSPIRMVRDSGEGSGHQVIDFGDDRFIAYLGVTAIGDWVIDIYTIPG
ncbi:hypothetical protein AB0L59_00210 [Streptomyces sp. NPDC052109]|uniref:hypothetical protein n=1 Tax=Streptomyces sp. NPDC052109 TaxID=3155527 RepID=UPI003447E938